MPDDNQLEAGAAAVEWTPEPGCYLAGFGANRRATTVHDPLWARAVAVRSGRTRLVLISLDCLGLLRDRADAIAGELGLKPGQVMICATHTHSGPDTIGFWGPDRTQSGVDEAICSRLSAAAVAAGQRALAALRPTLLTVSRTPAPIRTAVNVRQPDVIDPTIGVLHFADADTGRGLATMVNWACHPETLGPRNTALSADFPHVLRQRLEQSLGGTAVYVNGALGAMVTVAAAEETFAEAARVGTVVADTAIGALRATEEVLESAEIAVTQREVAIPITADRYLDALGAGLIPNRLQADGTVPTTVTAWRLDDITLLGIPGEVEPGLGRRWKRMMGSRHRFLLGLANDELGYLLPREKFDDDAYAYEQSMSPGPETAELLGDAVQRVLAAVNG